LNAPLTTSAGRLFDAIAAILGFAQVTSHEGQAACELEWACDRLADVAGYHFALHDGTRDAPWTIDWEPVLRSVLFDIGRGCTAGLIAARFHTALAAMIAEIALRTGERTVVLTGGCFQNVRLTESTIAMLRYVGATPYWHERVPPNDGGLALGQAFWAARTIEQGEAPCA
jgi:hydrogenase maturation protein HypF